MKKFNKLLITLSVLIFTFLSCTQHSSSTSKESDVTSNANETFKHRRFFSDNSFWNQPISVDAEADSRSDKWIKLLQQEPTGENFGLTWKKWTVPVYEADENTEYVNVKYHYLSDIEKKVWITNNKHEHFGHGSCFNPVPIPKGANPDPENDAHFCVIDWNRILVWDMWGLRKLNDGSWESNTGMLYRLDGDGIFDSYELGCVDGESVHFHGPSRASGVPVIAGLIMYDEVMEGEIKHKLSCASRYVGYREYVYPACWTDGAIIGGIPEGAVIQLDPNLDLTPFKLTPEETIIAKALQKYGMVLVDGAGGQPIYVEGLWGKPNKSWDDKLRDWDGGINDIPFEYYRILKVENSVLKGDGRKEKKQL